MPVDDPLYVRQADSRALELVGAMKTLEDAEQLRGVCHLEADTVVAHEDYDLAIRLLGHTDLDPRAGGFPRILHRVGDEIREDEAKHRAISAQRRQRPDLPIDRTALHLK